MAEEVVVKRGAFFSYGDLRLGQGRENAKTFLAENPAVAEEIDSLVRNRFGLPVVLAPKVRCGGRASMRCWKIWCLTSTWMWRPQRSRCAAGRAHPPVSNRYWWSTYRRAGPAYTLPVFRRGRWSRTACRPRCR